MKILITTGIFPPDIGGPAIYSQKIARELLQHDCAVVVITYCDKFKFEISSNNQNPNVQNPPPPSSPSACGGGGRVRAVRVSRNLPLPLKYFLYFLKVLWYGRNVDLIYLQDPVSAGFPTTLANLFLRKKLALKVVGDYSWEQYQQYNNSTIQQFIPLDEFYPFEAKKYPTKIWLFQKIQTWVAGRADEIITPSEYLKNIVQKWGISGDKIHVVYNAVNIENVSQTKKFLRESAYPDLPAKALAEEGGQNQRVSLRAGGPQGPEAASTNTFTIISVGRLVPWKGFCGLVKVFSKISDKYPDLRLKIIGEGPERKNIQLLITNYQLQNKIKFLGSLPHQEALQQMASSSLFVLNTAYEGLSHVILEALAVGVPVITTTDGGNPEVIKDGWNGILVKHNDSEDLKLAVIKMIEDKDFRERCVENGLRSLEKFDNKKMLEQTFKILGIKD